MTIRIAINGFGRMGRLGFRAGWGNPAYEIVHINEIAADSHAMAHLLEFDSVHGRWDKNISTDVNTIIVDGKRVGYSSEKNPADIEWAAMNVDMVIECTGQFKTKAALQCYFEQGIKKVLVSAPVSNPAVNIVYGINQHEYKPEQHNIITAASCTTNCLAPFIKVMKDTVGIKHGCMTTIHDITNTQTIVDKGHKDLRRARACGQSLIPTSTGSAKAITNIFPELKGKLNGHAVRVPLLNASLTDFVFEAERKTTVEEINELFKQASENELKDILGYEERPLVSVDYVNDPRSSIIDALSTMVVNDTQVKIYAWYDNEWGYVNRMMELAAFIASRLK
ncbi:NAD-dependent glyceraldehyde-3-phosphate dehydrogenase for arsenate detoxification [hydrothermal vent metagenome]|uniref:NAD-dependent glyceraldehyde-3-phosphate dehydrogenase for arsenate detoxification n=1 Tax=hydrothermal vent metagenome TaxID=652676 RepID=A0A3B1AA56_9ZZZZ